MKYPFLKNKTAVISGAGGALCSAAAIHLAKHGARVALLGRTQSSLDQVAENIREEGGIALTVVTDVNDAAAVRNARAIINQELGPCDYLLNGAGGNHPEAVTTCVEFTPEELSENKPEDLRGFFNLDLERFQEILSTNTLGSVIPCQVFGEDMATKGRGSILNYASMNSYRPLTRVPAYAMAKAAIVNFTMWLSVYLAPTGVRVNAIAPGFFLNNRNVKILKTPEGDLTARGQNVMHHTPLNRFGEAKDLFGAMCWLLNDEESNFVTGITIPVDGGFIASSGI
ncbi:SDR family oxidoreductase [Cerasicoccus fimbriatus]|uniref:SDR family oxidoreductase n=1 Tax=Cerasicoccus fimbriatus TaxID=3014554 RepID=UPI0022B38049|nr:SDR family oxidoreductase [Cerasicoccus sp. TK19100]